MPKMKTKKAAAKRYSFTGTGKVKYKQMGHSTAKKSLPSAKTKFTTRQTPQALSTSTVSR